jgi:hypothetical protein
MESVLARARDRPRRASSLGAGCRPGRAAERAVLERFTFSRFLSPFPRLRTRGRILAASLLVLLPAFWQSRLQAGDLSSHLYNAWLVELIRQGRAPGLTLAHPGTNILFDWMLSFLFRTFGPGPAQRIAVAAAVLVFVWGAFALVSTISGDRGWRSLPWIAVLAYGWVFHMGFFNFYISLGLCFGIVALCWRGSLRQSLFALPLLALAWLAHALPVVWTLGVLAYWFAARWLPSRLLLISASGGIILLAALIRIRMPARWLPTQFLSATGLDQVWVYDAKYLLIVFGYLLIVGIPIAASIRALGPRKLFSDVPFQLCALMVFAMLVLPDAVMLPGYNHFLAYIGARMSLPLAVFLTGVAARGPKRAIHRYVTVAVALAFFAFLYHDERALNAFEDKVERLVANIPPGRRVISEFDAEGLRVNALIHIIDRVCVGKCYSYANYEPGTAQFRVRALGANPLVVATYKDSWAMQTGAYTVKPTDLPLFLVTLDSGAKPELISLRSGETPKLRQIDLW